MRTTTFVRTVVPLAAMSLLVPVLGVGVAAAEEGLRCRLVKEDIVDPGLTLEGGAGGFYTPTPGNMTCQGMIAGRKADPKALGRYLERGRYGTKDPDNCLAGEGDGEFSAIVPTDRGSARLSALFTFTYGQLPLRGGVIGGTVKGKGFSGSIDIIPLEGDCLFTPVTKIYTIDEIVFDPTMADWQLIEE